MTMPPPTPSMPATRPPTTPAMTRPRANVPSSPPDALARKSIHHPKEGASELAFDGPRKSPRAPGGDRNAPRHPRADASDGPKADGVDGSRSRHQSALLW